MAFYFIAQHKINNATGIINLARNIGGSVGMANVTTLLARRAWFYQAVLVSHLIPLDPAYQTAISGTRDATTVFPSGCAPRRLRLRALRHNR